MTATITSIAQAFDVGARTYCFHGRTSTVAAGALWTASAVWWFVSQAGTVTKRHHGLELVHTSTYDGEQVDLLIVDEDGTAEWATPATTSVSSAWDYTVYLDCDSGNDSNDGQLTTTPMLTLEAAMDEIRTNWTSGGNHRIVQQGTATIASAPTGSVWNFNSLANGFGSNLSGRIHFTQWAGETQAAINITGDFGLAHYGFATNQGLVVDGVNIQGPWSLASPGLSPTGINSYVTSANSTGRNIAILNCSFGGFGFCFLLDTSLAVSAVGDGDMDWFSMENVTFTANNNTDIYMIGCRYAGWYNVSWGDLNGAGTGSCLRFYQTTYWSMTDCSVDRTGVSWKGNIFRMNGGYGTGTWDTCRYGSVSNLSVVGSTECWEFDMSGPATHRYAEDVWIYGLSWDSTTSASNHMFGMAVQTGLAWDVSRIRITNCSGRAPDNGVMFLSIGLEGDGSTVTLKSMMVDQNTWYQGDNGVDAVFMRTTGAAANYADGCFTVLSNYAFCADTAGGTTRSFYNLVSPSTKIGASDYNVLGSAGTNTTNWSGSDSLATWQGATAFDDHSFVETSASHNLTNVTEGSWNPEPAADGTPSATLPQVRRGMPGLGYADADRYLRDATLPDAGSHEYGTGTLMDDPTFGGGGGGDVLQAAPLTLRLNLRI